MHIYVEREREREREGQTEREREVNHWQTALRHTCLFIERLCEPSPMPSYVIISGKDEIQKVWEAEYCVSMEYTCARYSPGVLVTVDQHAHVYDKWVCLAIVCVVWAPK